MIVELVTVILLYLTFLVLATKRLMTYMHVLQQEEYDGKRLLAWIGKHKAFDKRLSFGLILLSIAYLYIPHFFTAFLVFIGFVITSYTEKDPRKDSKKKLVATDRAKRIFIPALMITAFLSAWVFLVLYPFNIAPWPWIVVLQLIPFVLLTVNAALLPFEAVIQKVYWNEAHKKLNELSPIVVGITGSFGKTSVKHILGHILSTQASTLITPGSVNTSMGITRIIRERLTEDHKYFIVEMGAYGPGSIKDLCDLAPPDYGVITAIGHAHYERFKSLETVSHAKYELAEATLAKAKANAEKPDYEGGKVIVHERTLRFPYGRQVKMDNKDSFVVCGEPPHIDPAKRIDTSYLEEGDIQILEVKQQPLNLQIKFSIGDKVYNVEPPIYGMHHGHNTVLAVATALEMGIDIGQIQVALKSLPQIAHRLEVKINKEDKVTLIDDSYNSNPVGFRSALTLMTLINNDGGRKILITPGMVELGVAHNDAHQKIGEAAAEICDIAVVVNPDRIPSFVKGFRAKGASKTIVEVASFAEANSWLSKNKQANDVVLIENDLPDMYERIPKM